MWTNWGADIVFGGTTAEFKKKKQLTFHLNGVVGASANVKGVAANVGFSFLIKVLFVGLFVFVNMMISCSVTPQLFYFAKTLCLCYKIEYVSADGN